MDKSENEVKLLAHLSSLAGILPEYTDNWQRQHITSATTQRRLLTAMGFDVSTPEKTAAAIKEHELRPWRRVLEPVSVVRQHEPWVRLVTRDTLADDDWKWRLDLETGGNMQGQFRPKALRKIKAREIEHVIYTARRLDLPENLTPGYHRLTL